MRPMKYDEHIDLVGLNVIDDSISPFNDLPNLFHVKFKYCPAGEGKLTDLLRATGEPIDCSFSICGRVLGDVLMDGIKMT